MKLYSIKPLEWERETSQWDDVYPTDYQSWAANTPIGRIRVNGRAGKEEWFLWLDTISNNKTTARSIRNDDGSLPECKTIAESQQAAETYYRDEIAKGLVEATFDDCQAALEQARRVRKGEG